MNRNTKKAFRTLIEQLSAMVGEHFAGLLIANLIDALQETVKGKDYVELRSLKIVVNDFFEHEVMKEEPHGAH